jgi:ketosteroid isomerase-like protein
MENSIKRFNPRLMATVLALALGVVSAVALRSTAAAQRDEEAAVRDVLLQNAAGFERGDLAALNQVWAHDEGVTVFENGHANYGWADYRDHHLVPEMAEIKNPKYTLTDIKVRVAGKTAWATFQYTIAADLKERHVEGGGLGTAVLEERNSRWQIVHWHTSSPRRAPAAASPAKKEVTP